jgi:putative membrane protein
LSVLVGGLGNVQNAIFPAVAAAFGTGMSGMGFFIGIGVGSAIIVLGVLFSYIRWKRLTYTIGANDIRVESGLLSRAARSVPYERIQDVSLEQKLLPRLLGLVSVKFETGAGGGEDLALAFLTDEEGEKLRQLVRARRDKVAAAPDGTGQVPQGDTPPAADGHDDGDDAEVLFTMGPARLFGFGAFEFSLAVFAVLAGLTQYANSFLDFDFWDPDLWESWLSDSGVAITGFGSATQAGGAIAALIAVFVVGSATGLARTFAREWGFLLERTPRGFRRRRGLFTRTDVVMPIHRVQGVKIGTGFIRYRFGWHGLRFVSLARDAGSSNHVVAPFAKMEEIAPIVEAAGFTLPQAGADWHRATRAYRTDTVILDLLIFVIAAIIAGAAAAVLAPDWTGLAIAAPLGLGALNAGANLIAWRFKRHTMDDAQIMAMSGVLSPSQQIATRVKLHSVEIAQGPISRLRGYATLHLGQAGGVFSIPGVPLERAREVRAKVLETIVATDFSQLEGA